MKYNKKLTQREFELLVFLQKNQKNVSQRDIAEHLACSVGTVNKIIKTLTAQHYCEQGQITPQGESALAPYRVQRAIFIAAGFGARLVPITLNTPKPLIQVHGERIIDALLDAVLSAEIPEIVIVRGYLKEQFDQLLYKYPQIKFVDNPYFNEYNNIASAMQIRDLLPNSYIMDADLVLKNPQLIRKYEFQTNLLGIPVENTDDWCVQTDKNGFAENISLGGINGYREVGISYWSASDGLKLAHDLAEIYHSPGGKERFWDQVPLFYKRKNYQIAIRKCTASDLIEIDTFNELKQVDQTYNI